ncbi:hypothetical protein [Caldalkalibacillus uzonensis]|uniref:hypothetical protein n=1 Tax=Caldalkalibacillus uzonensis TaxID=353224 RepID=UPI0027D83E9D|nr:hypothetical protein [Caldalkalibacillus uzonensis]
MRVGTIILVTVIVMLIALYEWPKINRHEIKEKRAFIVLTVMGWGLAVLLLYFPDLPGPNEWVGKIFGPLKKFVE